MRVVIPSGVQSKNGMVDVHIATPYGISPALSIPLACEVANCKSAPPKDSAPPPSIVVNPIAVVPPPAVSYSMPRRQITVGYVPDTLQPDIGTTSGKLQIEVDPKGSAPKRAKLLVTFQFSKGLAVADVDLDFKDGAAEIGGDNKDGLTKFAANLLERIRWLKMTGADIKENEVDSVAVQLMRADTSGGLDVQTVTVPSIITVKFKKKKDNP
jgi:hypothetical protein